MSLIAHRSFNRFPSCCDLLQPPLLATLNSSNATTITVGNYRTGQAIAATLQCRSSVFHAKLCTRRKGLASLGQSN
ncbi:hypothetical protein L1887_13871 [Cichorium endivia]|nr:hypothetical protein L1887_13871 [Cichorium endivia]